MKYKTIKDIPIDDVLVVANKTKVLIVDASSLYSHKTDEYIQPDEGDLVDEKDICDLLYSFSKKEWREINKRLEKYWQT